MIGVTGNLLKERQEKLSSRHWESIRRHGYSIIDGIFPDEVLWQYKNEINWLHKNERMSINHTHLVQKGETKLLPKKSILEAEMALESKSDDNTAALSSLFRSNAFLKSVHEQSKIFQPHSQMIKVQKNLGESGCFPYHYDTDGKDGRQLTAILYLNEEWKSEDGGLLQVIPFPQKPVHILPKWNRLVIFSSLDMLHRVTPSNRERDCLTIWLYGNAPTQSHFSINFSSDKDLEPWERALSFLCQDQLRRHFIKWIYREEWAKSIVESHPDTKETHDSLLVHYNDTGIIQKALGSLLVKNNYETTLREIQEKLQKTPINAENKP